MEDFLYMNYRLWVVVYRIMVPLNCVNCLWYENQVNWLIWQLLLLLVVVGCVGH